MAGRLHRRPPVKRPVLVATLACVGLIVAALFVIDGGDGLGLIRPNAGPSYLAVFALIAADAVVPVFPGETTLNAGATLAAQGELSLALVIIAGALGAIVGDSALFWIARRSSARVEPRLVRAKSNDKVAAALAFLDHGAPVVLITARYVPGLRFVVNATMGMSDMPYRSFLPWSALGGVIWATYTALLAYWVGSTLDDYPVASVAISGAITTLLIGLFFLHERRQRRLLAAAEPAP